MAGIKTYVYDLGGGLIEFIAIGTAVKRMPGAAALSPSLPTQAIIEDKTTFVNKAETALSANLNQSGRSNRTRNTQQERGPVTWWDLIKIVIRIAGG